MKKSAAILLALLMTISLAACGGTDQSSERTGQDTEQNENNSSGETSAQKDTADDPESAGTDGEKTLVAYFSATNTTEGVAEQIADGVGADLYEIVPEEPYTDADLDYNDDNSRTTIEMNDPSARPAISGSVENMDEYGIIFLGYPIWWGEAPRIMSTFMESYDFSGKTIVPFCTSGGSGIGSSAEKLAELTDGAQWVEGERFSGSASRDEIIEWVNGLGLNITAE